MSAEGHVHAADGDCDCYYTDRKRCIGGCGTLGKPDQYGKFLCDRCERADRGNR